MKLSLQIALGIIMAAAVIWGATELRARYELQQITEELAHRAAAAKKLAAELRAARAEKEQREHAAAVAANHRYAEQLQRKANATVAAEAKERAFLASYKAPKHCAAAEDWKIQVECGNHYMKAKQEFMAQ